MVYYTKCSVNVIDPDISRVSQIISLEIRVLHFEKSQIEVLCEAMLVPRMSCQNSIKRWKVRGTAWQKGDLSQLRGHRVLLAALLSC